MTNGEALQWLTARLEEAVLLSVTAESVAKALRRMSERTKITEDRASLEYLAKSLEIDVAAFRRLAED